MRGGINWKRLVAVGGAALAIVALWGYAGSSPAAASPNVDFSMAIPEAQGCNTVAGNTTCTLQPGSTFTVNVSLDSFPDTVTQYQGFDAAIGYTGAVTSADDATTSAWPDCGFPAAHYTAGFVAMGCSVGVPPAGPSTYLGLIGTNHFRCGPYGDATLTLKHGRGNTELVVSNTRIYVEDVNTPETITLSCGATPTPAPTATPTPTVVPALPSNGSGAADHQSRSEAWVIIGSLLVVASASLAVVGWSRSRPR
jgi:hypothetical protein